MIIPVRCFTCGAVLADKYEYFLRETRRKKIAAINASEKGDASMSHKTINNAVYLTKMTNEKTAEGEIMDDLGLINICCRRHILTHVDID